MMPALSLHKMLQPDPVEADESIFDTLLNGEDTPDTLSAFGEEALSDDEAIVNELAQQQLERQITNEKVKATYREQNKKIQGKQ